MSTFLYAGPMRESNSRFVIIAYVVVCYLLPTFFFAWFSTIVTTLSQSWLLFGSGLLYTVCSTLFLIAKLWQWESKLLEQVDHISSSKAQILFQNRSEIQDDTPITVSLDEIPEDPVDVIKDQILELEQSAVSCQKQSEELVLQLDQKNEQLQQVIQDKEGIQYQLEQTRKELAFYQQVAREQLKQKDTLIAEYTQTIQDLRTTMEKKQQQIGKLESSVSDLTYEVKTLVQISEMDSSPGTPKPMSFNSTNPVPQGSYPIKEEGLSALQEDILLQLKRFIDTAQKLTGAMHLGMTSRFRDVSVDSYALEQRRLFDSLRNETSSTILVYSQKDGKMLFVNNQIKNLLGWNPERFIQEFSDIIGESSQEWNRSLSQLISQHEIQTSLKLKNRSGQLQTISCLMGVVPTGIFKSHVIGILTSV